MTQLFRRKVEVVVDTLVLGDGGLDVAFEVERTLRRHPNKAQIRIWNLSASHRAQLEQLGSVRVRLRAGYQDGFAEIFNGDLRRAQSERDGADIVTTISGGDGELATRRGTVNRSFASPVNFDHVLQHLVDAIGVGVGNALSALTGTSLDQAGSESRGAGVVLSGRADDELDGLLTSAGLEWSIQDGALQVLPRGRALDGTAVRLAPDTGLIESPSVSTKGVLTARALLMPDLVPGRKVQIDATTVSGFFRMKKGTYVGDTASDDWSIGLEGEPLAA